MLVISWTFDVHAGEVGYKPSRQLWALALVYAAYVA